MAQYRSGKNGANTQQSINMPQVQTSGDIMELKGLRRKVLEELGPEVTQKLGGPVQAANVFFEWSRGSAEDPEMKVLTTAYKANYAVYHTRQVAVVRYLVGGPSLLKPEDMVRQDDAMARKSGGVRLSPDMVQKANRDFVNVLKRSGCSQDVVEEVTQRMLELEKGWEQVRAHPTKRHICFCCSVQ